MTHDASGGVGGVVVVHVEFALFGERERECGRLGITATVTTRGALKGGASEGAWPIPESIMAEERRSIDVLHLQ